MGGAWSCAPSPMPCGCLGGVAPLGMNHHHQHQWWSPPCLVCGARSKWCCAAPKWPLGGEEIETCRVSGRSSGPERTSPIEERKGESEKRPSWAEVARMGPKEEGREGAAPIRCLGCRAKGHGREACPVPPSLHRRCYWCGARGHRAAACRARPFCWACHTRGRRSVRHAAGGRGCPEYPQDSTEDEGDRGNMSSPSPPSTPVGGRRGKDKEEEYQLSKAHTSPPQGVEGGPEKARPRRGCDKEDREESPSLPSEAHTSPPSAGGEPGGDMEEKIQEEISEEEDDNEWTFMRLRTPPISEAHTSPLPSVGGGPGKSEEWELGELRFVEEVDSEQDEGLEYCENGTSWVQSEKREGETEREKQETSDDSEDSYDDEEESQERQRHFVELEPRASDFTENEMEAYIVKRIEERICASLDSFGEKVKTLFGAFGRNTNREEDKKEEEEEEETSSEEEEEGETTSVEEKGKETTSDEGESQEEELEEKRWQEYMRRVKYEKTFPPLGEPPKEGLKRRKGGKKKKGRMKIQRRRQ